MKVLRKRSRKKGGELMFSHKSPALNQEKGRAPTKHSSLNSRDRYIILLQQPPWSPEKAHELQG